jgi:hypothetical protein
VLYLDHSVDGLTHGRPSLLGTLCRGSSEWQALSEKETATWGGTSLRRLYGCVITMVAQHSESQTLTSGSCSLAAVGGADHLFRQVLLTWSQVFSNMKIILLLTLSIASIRFCSIYWLVLTAKSEVDCLSLILSHCGLD